MKEGHNLSYVTKMGAYGLAVVATFAVALAVLMSVASTAEALVYNNIPKDTSAGTVNDGANNGDTVYIKNAEGAVYVRFEIETTGSAAASFTHSDADDDGQGILCREADDLAKNKCDADTRVSGGDGVTVALKIDDDSGKGVIFVKQTTVPVSGEVTVTTDTIDVTVAQVPASIVVSASPKSVNSGQGTEAEPTTLAIRLTDTDGKGIAGESLTVIASHGTLTVAEADDRPAAWTLRDVETTTDEAGGEYNGLDFEGGGTQVGTLITSSDLGAAAADGAGYAAVVLTGGGAPGVATVTVRQTNGTIVGTGSVTLFGPAKTITAEAEQSAIAIGESTFIVVTVVDSGDNPVANATASVKGTGGRVPPTKLDTPVAQARNVNKDVDSDGELDSKTDIPACQSAIAVEADDTADPPVVAAFASPGTNRDGQCVIQITATDDKTSLNNDTARGEHTITIVGSADGEDPRAIDAVEVVIQVGGAPATISTDAPERLDPSGELTVNITVVDDEEVRVGKVTIEVIQTAGDGKIITEAKANTSDGRAKFTYLAPSTPGVAEFLVRTKAANGAVTSQLPVIVQIAVAMEDVPDDPITPVVVPVTPVDPVTPVMAEATLSVTFNLGVFSGGSVEDLHAAAEAACAGGADIWLQDADGGWQLYRTSAPVFANAPFAAAFADGIGQVGVYVASCDEGSMENEGSMGEEG